MPSGPKLVLADRADRVRFYEGDSFDLLRELPENSVDCVWTDPPYNLSNDGITCVAGKMVKVNKGEWDRSQSIELHHQFNRESIRACKRLGVRDSFSIMIRPDLKPLLELLQGDFQLIVPDYQRPYSWKSDEVSELLEDLQGYIGKSQGLYLGSIILDVSKQDEKRVEIVDGQQRLTTLFLLLIACRDHARSINATQQAEKTQSRITFTGAILNETIGMKLVASESIRHIFEIMASSDWDTRFPDDHRLQVRRLKPLYLAFRESLSKLDANELAQFQSAILSIRVMRIDIDAKEEAFSIFERTNARGLDLEVADLMKNYLYQTAGAEVGVVWNKVRSHAGHAMLRMLKSFYVAHKGYVQKAELYKNLRKYAESLGGGAKLAGEILEYSEFFSFTQAIGTNPDTVGNYFAKAGYKGISGKQDRVLEAQASLQGLALFKVKQTQALIFAALLAIRRLGLASDATAAKSFTRLLHALECFHFINTSICSHIGNEVEHLYADFCVDFSKTSDFVKMVDIVIGQLRKRRAPRLEFAGNFRAVEYSMTSKPKLAYIFDRLNNVGRSPGERKVMFFPDKSEFDKSLNIEHIYAQNAKGAGPKPQNVDNIGNLVVIGRQLNSKLAAKSVEDKFKEMQGPSASRVAEFPAVGKLVMDFASQANVWNDEVIVKRADSLAEFGYDKVWSF